MSPTPHSEQHEEALCELLESADPRAGLRESELAECGACQTQLAQLIQLREGLDHAALAQEQGLGEAAQTDSGLPASHVRDALQDVLSAPQPRSRSWGPIAALISIAAALILLFTYDFNAEPVVDPMTIMGVESAEGILSPRTKADSRGVFRWEPDEQSNSFYQVHVHNADGEQNEIGTSPKIQGSCEWTPSESEIQWNDVRAFFWTVDIYRNPVGDPSNSYEIGPIEL